MIRAISDSLHKGLGDVHCHSCKVLLVSCKFGDTDRLVGNREEETPEDFLLEEADRGAYLSDGESRCVLLERKTKICHIQKYFSLDVGLQIRSSRTLDLKDCKSFISCFERFEFPIRKDVFVEAKDFRSFRGSNQQRNGRADTT